MGRFRVLQEFTLDGPRTGQKRVMRPGQLVEILLKNDVRRLVGGGFVTDAYADFRAPYEGKDEMGKPIVTMLPGRRRIVVWMPIRGFYSGGRIHIFQYAWALAALGNHVLIAGERKPVWWDDYPKQERLTFTTRDPSMVPDIDLLVVDGKNAVARKGLKLAKDRGVPLVIWNFETPNWFKLFLPDLVHKIQYHDEYKGCFREATIALANSGQSKKYLREWIGQELPPIEVLRPAVNTSKNVKVDDVPRELKGRRYALISGRADSYKNQAVSLKAVMGFGGQCDLAAVGGNPGGNGDAKHRLHGFKQVSDSAKFALMRNAAVVLAPSDFEGFGMVPSEALSVGTQAVVYDLPVLREEYGDRLTYVERGNVAAFCAKAHEMIASGARAPAASVKWANNRLGLGAMKARVNRMPLHQSTSCRISALMNAYACERTVEYALRSVYPHVHEIIVAYGCEERYDWPADSTLDILRAFPDPDGKLTIIEKAVWPGKQKDSARRAMREACCARVTGNYGLILDADELWVGLGAMVKEIEVGKIAGGCPLAVTFWHDAEHHVVSQGLERWGLPSPTTKYGTVWPHVRVFPWRASYNWRSHVVPLRPDGARVWSAAQNLKTVEVMGERTVLYHLGHALPKDMMALKKRYYKERDGGHHGRAEKAWFEWDGKLGNCKDGIVKAVDWELPALIAEAMENVRG